MLELRHLGVLPGVRMHEKHISSWYICDNYSYGPTILYHVILHGKSVMKYCQLKFHSFFFKEKNLPHEKIMNFWKYKINPKLFITVSFYFIFLKSTSTFLHLLKLMFKMVLNILFFRFFFILDVDKQVLQYLLYQYLHILVDLTLLPSLIPGVENSVYLYHYNSQEINGIQISYVHLLSLQY